MKEKTILSAICLSACIYLMACSSTSVEGETLKQEISSVKLGDFDEVELGAGTLYLKNVFSASLQRKDFSVMLYPDNGTAGILYKTTLTRLRLALDEDARNKITNAYNTYLKDYDEKKLDRKQTKFKAVYGSARARFAWGSMSYTYYGNPKISMGYIFAGKSPYFCIMIPATEAVKNESSYLTIRNGGDILYFTRAQAGDLIKAISDDEIQDAINTYYIEE